MVQCCDSIIDKPKPSGVYVFFPRSSLCWLLLLIISYVRRIQDWTIKRIIDRHREERLNQKDSRCRPSWTTMLST